MIQNINQDFATSYLLIQSTYCVWRATTLRDCFDSAIIFQSTPSVWRATEFKDSYQVSNLDFNPHPPCGGRQKTKEKMQFWTLISIHTLRVEGDILR